MLIHENIIAGGLGVVTTSIWSPGFMALGPELEGCSWVGGSNMILSLKVTEHLLYVRPYNSACHDHYISSSLQP